MVVSQYNSDFSKQLNGSFYWFTNVLYVKLRERLKEFLLSDFNIRIVAVCEKDNSLLFNGEDYFVTRIKVDKRNEVYFRISAALMDSILGNTLGGREKAFVPEEMTELEAKILTSLNDFIFKGLSPFLLKNPNYDENTNPNLAHITFLTKDAKGVSGKLIVSIPIAILPEVRPASYPIHFDMGSFPKYKVPVKIISGKSELTLYDTQHIDVGDIVVLEQSNIKMMTIEVFGRRKDFKINPETSIITGIDDDGGASMENNPNPASGNMWDVIPVEISAEFDRVEITLGDLKQISEGAVVDVGTIYENKIFLKVENKPIASGELIIINDKYAVRVDKVLTETPTQQPAAPQPAAQRPAPQAAAQRPAPQPAQAQRPAPQAAQAQNANGDDFNYDNFDIEDEDI